MASCLIFDYDDENEHDRTFLVDSPWHACRVNTKKNVFWQRRI